MIVEGVDFSWGRPDPKCLYRSGKRFAVRYTSSDPSKNMSPAEVAHLTSAGLALVTVWQQGKAAPLGGRPRGVTAALQARAQAASCGMPKDRPIYFALDQDPASFTETQWKTIGAFYDGAGSIIGSEWVGAYGGLEAIERLCGPGRLRWGWQTRSWSTDPKTKKVIWSLKAQLRQTVVDTDQNPVRLCGAAVDHDEAWVADYGQWRPGEAAGDWFDRATVNDVQRVVAEELRAVLL